MLLAIGTALTGVAPVAAVAGPAADQGLALSALASLAAAAWAAARLVAHRAPELRVALDATALGALGLFSGVALDGVALTLALAGEAAALAAVARRHGHDPVVLPAALAFLGGALAHALFVLAPPEALVAGLDDPLHAALGVGAVVLAAAFAAAATRDRQLRPALAAGAALLALHLASALLVTPFQPGADAAAQLPLAELDVRQQGQMLLSMLWAITGVATLVAGLLGDRRGLRLAALALLTVTTAKVFVFDLASLTSLYRVGSCVALGVLLLAGGFAWQRIRPRALPDLRGVPVPCADRSADVHVERPRP